MMIERLIMGSTLRYTVLKLLQFWTISIRNHDNRIIHKGTYPRIQKLSLFYILVSNIRIHDGRNTHNGASLNVHNIKDIANLNY